ncbi:MAG TPA: DMT family transporter [Candidatus Mediterraneibacter stercorigallinarum]|uniref:DMT family transporter n=1 Tax=Candidatus Mediterraneibacter stercorigallinarum TaxID=2838686 RepID=A0A9D2IJR5_9FIRM|nr:DMT family transporter [Candidatus Mediterraneibacter stercorigallinarum]
MAGKIQNPAAVCALALLCCALWGSAFPCIKLGYEWLDIEGTGSQILFAGYRFFLSGIFTFVIGCVIERKFLTMKRSSVWHIFRQGLLQTTVQYVCFYIGLAYATGAKSSIINASQGFVAIIASHFMLKSEKMTWKKAAGCVLGLTGVVVVNLAPGAWGSGFSLKGEGMIVLCTVVYGISMVLLKMISDEESPMTITAYQTLTGGALLVLTGAAAGGHVGGFTAKSVILLIYMALLSTAAFSIWTILMKYNPVGKVAVYTFTIPIFGVALSGLLLGEQVLEMKNLIALVLVSAGIIIVNKK